MLQAGTYFGTLVAAGTDTLNNEKKTPYFYLTFQIEQQIDEDGNCMQIEPVSRDVMLYLTDAAVDYTLKKLKALGFNGNFETPTFNTELTEIGCKLYCTHNPSGDKTYENWSLENGGNSEKERKPLSRDITRKFEAKYKSFAEVPAKSAGGLSPEKQAKLNAGRQQAAKIIRPQADNNPLPTPEEVLQMSGDQIPY